MSVGNAYTLIKKKIFGYLQYWTYYGMWGDNNHRCCYIWDPANTNMFISYTAV